MKASRLFAKLTLSCGFLCLLLSISTMAAEISETVNSDIELIISDNKGSELQLEVKQQPLERVLGAVSSKTHVPIHYSVVPDGLVTATCVGPTLTQIMECLLAHKADLVVRYAKPSSQIKKTKLSNNDQPVEMWILGAKFTAPENCSGSSMLRPAITNPPIKPTNEQANTTETEPDQTDDLLKMASSKDANIRAEAIGALLSAGREGDINVKKALEDALNDPNANVRAQAISSLAHREGSAAVTGALQEALHDADSGVRLMAVDAAGDNIELLKQAINDEDKTIQKLAISKLEELQKSGK